jgi:hypothetical protein
VRKRWRNTSTCISPYLCDPCPQTALTFLRAYMHQPFTPLYCWSYSICTCTSDHTRIPRAPCELWSVEKPAGGQAVSPTSEDIRECSIPPSTFFGMSELSVIFRIAKSGTTHTPLFCSYLVAVDNDHVIVVDVDPYPGDVPTMLNKGPESERTLCCKFGQCPKRRSVMGYRIGCECAPATPQRLVHHAKSHVYHVAQQHSEKAARGNDLRGSA